jgi:CelD/BcsL family acetyltransferase involved in cellulose biosynthesis
MIAAENLERGIEDWNRVYELSWKKPEPFPEFVPALIRLCAARGWLRLGLAYYDDQPVASQIWIVNNDRACIYKMAYDGKMAKLSAGSVLSAHLMAHVIDVEKVTEVDYLIGDDAYKKDWMSHRRERWGLVAYNPRSPAGLAGLVGQVAGNLRRALRTGAVKPPTAPGKGRDEEDSP